MRKTIFCLSLFLLVSICFVTSVTVNAAPIVTRIHGGYGITATVIGATGRHWQIDIKGPFLISGKSSVGTISRFIEKIHTNIFPPLFGIGKIYIKVTINRIILPDIVEERSGFIVGTLVLFVNNPKCDDND